MNVFSYCPVCGEIEEVYCKVIKFTVICDDFIVNKVHNFSKEYIFFKFVPRKGKVYFPNINTNIKGSHLDGYMFLDKKNISIWNGGNTVDVSKDIEIFKEHMYLVHNNCEGTIKGAFIDDVLFSGDFSYAGNLVKKDIEKIRTEVMLMCI